MALVKYSDKGPVFYGHSRIGHKGRSFKCLKFRTMAVDGERILRNYLRDNPEAAEEWRATRKLRDDPRVTAVGRVLRKLSLDELPQLINILRGEMSVVGPRPVVDDELKVYDSFAVYYLQTRPGLTGLWQISGRNDVSYETRIAFDTQYVQTWSLVQDLAIILRTIPAVCLARGSLPKLVFAAGIIVVSLAGVGRAEDNGYRLGVMDKLRIRVAEWQPADGSIRNWDVVSGDYTVGPTGSLSLPFIGDLDAAGKTPAEVANSIGEGLRTKFALRNLPSASVEVAQFRPVFLAGDVDRPGEYPFTPNLTVLKAVSLSGGLRKSDAGQRFARDFINARGDMTVYDSERSRLIARRARLLAEVSGSKQLEMPPELKDVKNAEQLLASESALMKSRRDRYELQLKALTDLKALLSSEVQSLAQKAETQKRQLELVSDNREKMSRLTEQGLATSNRLLTIEERSADVESTLLDIDTAALRAKQDISKADQDEINLRNDWEAQRAKELQDTEAELEKLGLQLSTSRELMSEALSQSAEALKFDLNGKGATIKYVIVRDGGDGPREVAADENTPLAPGDVVKVTAELLMQ
eukprot:g9889.t1